MATKLKKSWTQKWDEAKAKGDLPKVFDCEKSGMRFSVPGPAEVEEIVRRTTPGQVLTSGQIAEELAKKHGSEMCCPMTTGIFAWLMAQAAAEAKDDTLPWWRVVKAKGELNPKYPGAPELQKALLESEGRTVVAKGKRVLVEGVK
jgi:alkylated DNA nucleotide flippase Atl1